MPYNRLYLNGFRGVDKLLRSRYNYSTCKKQRFTLFYLVLTIEEIEKMQRFDDVVKWIKKMTEAGVALVALAIVLQILFGKAVPFIGGDVVGSITAIVANLGAQGLVGLAAVAVMYAIFTRPAQPAK